MTLTCLRLDHVLEQTFDRVKMSSFLCDLQGDGNIYIKNLIWVQGHPHPLYDGPLMVTAQWMLKKPVFEFHRSSKIPSATSYPSQSPVLIIFALKIGDGQQGNLHLAYQGGASLIIPDGVLVS